MSIQDIANEQEMVKEFSFLKEKVQEFNIVIKAMSDCIDRLENIAGYNTKSSAKEKALINSYKDLLILVGTGNVS